MNETQLISECLKGNYRAQKKLFNHFSPLMMGICMRYASNREDAEDILQEGFIKVFKNLSSFQQRGPLGAWIRRIMINTALQIFRENKNLLLNVEIEKYDFMIESDDDIFAQISADELRKKIQQLPSGYRVVFNLYAIEGYTHIEISKELKISVGTSKSQYSRARALLRKIIDEENKAYNISEKAV